MSSSEIVQWTSDNDVLLGRGSALMFHVGNLKYRQLVEGHREEYRQINQQGKHGVAKKVVAIVRESGGRFLRRAVELAGPEMEASWTVIDDRTALEKVKQSLREKRKLLRTEKMRLIKQKSSGNDPATSTTSKKAHEPLSLLDLVGADRRGLLPAGTLSDETIALSGILGQSHDVPFRNSPSLFPSLALQLRAGIIANQGLASFAALYEGNSPPLLHGTLVTDPVKKRQEELFQKVLHK